MSIFRRLVQLARKPDDWDAVNEPLRPRVMPDADDAAELQRRRDALSYQPREGFLVGEDTQ